MRSRHQALGPREGCGGLCQRGVGERPTPVPGPQGRISPRHRSWRGRRRGCCWLQLVVTGSVAEYCDPQPGPRCLRSSPPGAGWWRGPAPCPDPQVAGGCPCACRIRGRQPRHRMPRMASQAPTVDPHNGDKGGWAAIPARCPEASCQCNGCEGAARRSGRALAWRRPRGGLSAAPGIGWAAGGGLAISSNALSRCTCQGCGEWRAASPEAPPSTPRPTRGPHPKRTPIAPAEGGGAEP